MDPVGTTVSTLKGVWMFIELVKKYRDSLQEVFTFEKDVKRFELQLMLLRDLRTRLRNFHGFDGEIQDALIAEQKAWATFIKMDNDIFDKISGYLRDDMSRENANVMGLKLRFFWLTTAKSWVSAHTTIIESSYRSLESQISNIRAILQRERDFNRHPHHRNIILPFEALRIKEGPYELPG